MRSAMCNAPQGLKQIDLHHEILAGFVFLVNFQIWDLFFFWLTIKRTERVYEMVYKKLFERVYTWVSRRVVRYRRCFIRPIWSTMKSERHNHPLKYEGALGGTYTRDKGWLSPSSLRMRNMSATGTSHVRVTWRARSDGIDFFLSIFPLKHRKKTAYDFPRVFHDKISHSVVLFIFPEGNSLAIVDAMWKKWNVKGYRELYQ